MKDTHNISDPISENYSVILYEEEEESSHESPVNGIGTNQTEFCDVLKLILDLDKYTESWENRENRDGGRVNWGDITDNSDFNFGDILLSMKICIQHFNLDPKQALAFSVICSSSMLAMNQQLQKIVQILRRKMQQESCWRKWLIQA
jgi:hypothetical protein